MSDVPVISAQANRLKDAAFALACDRGLAALSARALSAEVGGSPSAINYYFGNRELLDGEIHARAVERSEAWRAANRSLREDRRPIWAGLDHVFTGLVQDRLQSGAKVLALLNELELEAGSGRSAICAAASDEAAAETAFWRDLAASYGEGPARAELWSDLAAGLVGLMLSEPDAARRSAWISAPAARLLQRLERRPVALTPHAGPDAARLAALSPGSDTMQRILDAAIANIADKGPERLVQREVAAIAGVSLAAVTYFYPSKQGLLSAAFNELCRRHCVGLGVEEKGAAVAADPQQYAAMEATLAFNDPSSLTSMAAMLALLRAAVRMPILAPIAEDIRNTRGVATLVLLRRMGLKVDRLDAFVWASISAGHYHRTRFLPPAERAARMGDCVRRMLSIVFASGND